MEDIGDIIIALMVDRYRLIDDDDVEILPFKGRYFGIDEDDDNGNYIIHDYGTDDDYLLFRFEDSKIDLFSEYHIRMRRTICMDYDPTYAARELIKTYNSEVAPGLGNIIDFSAIKSIFVMNYIASRIVGGVNLLGDLSIQMTI